MNLSLTNSCRVAIIDAEDWEKCSKFNWHLSRGYVQTYVIPETWYLARFLLGIFPGDIDYVDHRDFNKLNNCKENLRVCTKSQSMANRHSFCGSSSKYKGVSRHNKTKKWQAEIGEKYLGLFESEIEAAKFRDVAALQRYGEFAFLNFPNG